MHLQRQLAFLFLFVFVSFFNLNAQPTEQFIKVVVAPDHTNWEYKVGERVKFTVSVLQNDNLLKNTIVRYELGPEKLPATKKDSLLVTSGSLTVQSEGMKTSGFLRLIAYAYVNGKQYKGLATAGFEPMKISPTVALPDDFNAFWENAKNELAQIPIDATITLLPERCTEKVNVYHVNLQNYGNSRLYGILCIPKANGKYPAILRVPGAGVRPYSGDIATAEKGFITLEIGIHGIPVTMDPSVYTSLGQGALSNYWNYNMDNRDRFYYKRVYLGCVRANDFIDSLPQYDGTHLGVTGGSQGGALSIITAALDSRVKYLAAFYPALSDVTGYLQGRAGGWPHYFDKTNITFNNTKEKIATVAYYDVVNFAKQLKVPGNYSWGFNDETCPPTSMYAAYNQIKAPKQLYLALETGHWSYSEQNEKLSGWLQEQLKNK
ncbi:acetylxylan esterase [Segetibacter koreensis]|uniref:acetylxylan esterase n=1 Tax=Segetibacter koreensis TaxID=398037 RepID=UPI0004773C19|nr:acetylxylan esterase [Segetibacter koreensis]